MLSKSENIFLTNLVDNGEDGDLIRVASPAYRQFAVRLCERENFLTPPNSSWKT
jgi:hypothetical protein